MRLIREEIRMLTTNLIILNFKGRFLGISHTVNVLLENPLNWRKINLRGSYLVEEDVETIE